PGAVRTRRPPSRKPPRTPSSACARAGTRPGHRMPGGKDLPLPAGTVPGAGDRRAAPEKRAPPHEARTAPWLPLMAMAKLRLDLDPDPDVTVIGISSHVHDHRLCWALNRSMGLRLTRRRKDITEVNEGREACFATFDQAWPPSEEHRPRLTLVHNHSGEGILLREQKQADFFLV